MMMRSDCDAGGGTGFEQGVEFTVSIMWRGHNNLLTDQIISQMNWSCVSLIEF